MTKEAFYPPDMSEASKARLRQMLEEMKAEDATPRSRMIRAAGLAAVAKALDEAPPAAVS